MGRPRINTPEMRLEKARIRLRAWRKNNPKKLAQQTRRRREKYGDKERKTSRDWYRKHPEASKSRVWPNNLKRFGMTPADYLEMFEAQGERCACCKRERLPTERRFAVDHNHETHEIRGILCPQCNLGLGYFKEDAEKLRAAAAYLEQIRVTKFKLADPAKYASLRPRSKKTPNDRKPRST